MRTVQKRITQPLANKRMLAILLTTPLAVFAVPAPAQAPDLAALTKLDKGQWEIRPRGKGARIQKICIRDTSELLKIRHIGDNCDAPFIIENKSNVATVSYSCGAKGHGRTTIRTEDNGLFQINTQGIANNSPFSVAAEGRRIGSC